MLHELPQLADLPPLAPEPQAAPGQRDVHLWYAEHGTRRPPAGLPWLLALLPDAERDQYARLRDAQRQRRFLIGRALCRQALSRYAPTPPDAWELSLGSRGKPTLASCSPTAPLWFNLSHTDTLSICAITGAGPGIGVDVEPLATGDNVLAIAEQFFPEAEADALLKLPTALRRQAFVRLWALKESFVKASELSLADGLSGAAFDLSRPDAIAVTFREPLHERPDAWQFRLLQAEGTHLVALAVRTDRKIDGACRTSPVILGRPGEIHPNAVDGRLQLRAGSGLQV